VPAKPKSPYPLLVRHILKKILPQKIYRKHVGRHEDNSLQLWSHISRNIPLGKSILDIGAFKGDYAIAARENNATVEIYAFEPNPQSANILRIFSEDFNIEVEELAVAELNGSVSFLLNSKTSQMINPEEKSLENVIQVQATSLNSWVSEKRTSPSLIKIDTEGAEAGILRGANFVLRHHQPIILCEVLSDKAGVDVMGALPKNYIYYHIDENNGIEARTLITRKVWRNHNWLLVPKHRKSELPIYIS
jgi:FkbM family methyltransferase